jgi:hypothetical protein
MKDERSSLPPKSDGSAPHLYHTFKCSCCGHCISAPVSCGDRFCDICSGPRRRRIRAKLNAIVDQVVERDGYTVKFLTLTIPSRPDIRSGTKDLIASFRRLRQTKFWRGKVKGGAFVVEITGRPGAWHIHLHALIESLFLDTFKLSTQWRKCSPGKIVDIRRIPKGSIVSYVTKYMTKTNLDQKSRYLITAELKQLRLFQPFGTWHSMSLLVQKLLYDCPECGFCCWWPTFIRDEDNPFIERSPPEIRFFQNESCGVIT